jgi:hypothetical protein
MIQRDSSRLDCVSPIFPFWWFSEPFLGDFLVVALRPFSLGFGGVCLHETFVVLLLVIPLPNPWIKGLNFGVFLGFGKVVFLVEILRFLLIQWVLVDQNKAMGWPWGAPSIPKVLCESVEWIGRSGSEFGGVDPRLAIHPELPRPDRSDRCKAPVGFALGECLVHVALGCGAASQFLAGFNVFYLVFWRFFVPFSLSFEGDFLPWPRGLTEVFWNFVVQLLLSPA